MKSVLDSDAFAWALHAPLAHETVHFGRMDLPRAFILALGQ